MQQTGVVSRISRVVGLSILEGILYMPTQTILVTGNGDVNGSSTYFGMVAKDFSFQGNGQFNLVPQEANTTLTDIMATIPIVTNVRLSH